MNKFTFSFAFDFNKFQNIINFNRFWVESLQIDPDKEKTIRMLIKYLLFWFIGGKVSLNEIIIQRIMVQCFMFLDLVPFDILRILFNFLIWFVRFVFQIVLDRDLLIHHSYYYKRIANQIIRINSRPLNSSRSPNLSNLSTHFRSIASFWSLLWVVRSSLSGCKTSCLLLKKNSLPIRLSFESRTMSQLSARNLPNKCSNSMFRGCFIELAIGRFRFSQQMRSGEKRYELTRVLSPDFVKNGGVAPILPWFSYFLRLELMDFSKMHSWRAPNMYLFESKHLLTLGDRTDFTKVCNFGELKRIILSLQGCSL